LARPRPLASATELDAAVAASAQHPVFVFKHSLVCPVSTRADLQFGDFVQACADGNAEFHRIEIQNARPVSNEVASRTGVRHESPQVLLFVDGEVVWHASHGSITKAALDAALAKAASD